MPRRGAQAVRAASLYKGIRLTLTQNPHGGACLVSVSTKRPEQSWEDWSLLFPPLRIEARPVKDYREVLRLLIDVLEGLTADGDDGL